ncbi:MAG TPA: PLP-dependent lyase/thiolase [Roseovarius sp.]|nr:PLP-dependent lyase/thiolase [Roseovarius sp.]
MDILENSLRGTGMDERGLAGAPWPSVDAAAVQGLLARCPAAAETPLVAMPGLGPDLWVKDERGRMGLGSFKALGAAYVIACDAAATGAEDMGRALEGRSYVTASAGNHGLSVAAGARVFGARAVVYLAETVPESFAARLRGKGAEVVRAGVDYAGSMAAAEAAAAAGDGTLLSDSSWPGYMALPHRLMEGYLAMAAEITAQSPAPFDVIALQAGVGGMAAAVAAHVRAVWGDGPRIVVVEPEYAPALIESIRAGRPVETGGPVSNMGRLDCKAPSFIALKGLARDADAFVTVTEDEAARVLPALAERGMATTESGAAGVAALMAMGLGPETRALAIISEEPEA